MKKLPRPRTLPKKHRTPVKAKPAANRPSNTLTHEYSPRTGRLTVTFAGGRQYRYEGVSAETAAGLESAVSKGGYLHAHVIGKHDAIKIGD